jgi:phosphatidylethanolamine/phosphatidyl-N-methylethanolamine N-methyltransferase
MAHTFNNLRYSLLAVIYDRALHWFYDGRARRLVGAIQAAPADEVLEIGVGTGISLRHYGPQRVTAIDCSLPMLRKARRKAAELPGLRLELVHAAAEDYCPRAHRYQHVVFCNSLSVIHQPRELLHAYYAALAPGGNIYILNHFTPASGPLRLFDRALTPVGKLLGFRSYFPLEAVAGPELLAHSRVLGGRYWRIVHIHKPLCQHAN